MSDRKEPISTAEHFAFNSALAVFGDWKYGDPKESEPKATYQRQPASIDLICDIVEKRAGQMPPTELLTLCDMASRQSFCGVTSTVEGIQRGRAKLRLQNGKLTFRDFQFRFDIGSRIGRGPALQVIYERHGS